MPYPRVVGVVTREGTDISAICNEAADRYGLPPQALVAQGIAESDLTERAARERQWPDVSYGLWQQTVKYAPIGDGTAHPGNIALVRERFTSDIAFAADVAARQLGHYYQQHGSYEEAASRYNGGPRMRINDNPNAANIRRAWHESARYIVEEQASVQVDHNPGTVAGTFTTRPSGIILHGSRSGRRQSRQQEYDATRRFAQQTELGWNTTIGEDRYAVHYSAQHWGWNARAASRHYLAVEIAQPLEEYLVTAAQVRALVAWYRAEVVPQWGEYPVTAAHWPTHAELEASGATGARDGKTDVYRAGSANATILRAEIAVLLKTPEEDMSQLEDVQRQLAEERAWGSAILEMMKAVRGELDAALALHALGEHEGAAAPVQRARDELARHE
jgi:hypothetical protein